jgi:hypothetical protein
VLPETSRFRQGESSSSLSDDENKTNEQSEKGGENETNEEREKVEQQQRKKISSNFASVSLNQHESEDLEEFDLNQLYVMAAKGEFPKKTFIFNGIKNKFTQMLHFFLSKRIFGKRPDQPVEFKCKICDSILNATFPHFTNLNNHLKIHGSWNRKWLAFFKEKFKKSVKAILDTQT